MLNSPSLETTTKNTPPLIFIPISSFISSQLCTKIMFIICCRLYRPAFALLKKGQARIFLPADNWFTFRDKVVNEKWLYYDCLFLPHILVFLIYINL